MVISSSLQYKSSTGLVISVRKWLHSVTAITKFATEERTTKDIIMKGSRNNSSIDANGRTYQGPIVERVRLETIN